MASQHAGRQGSGAAFFSSLGAFGRSNQEIGLFVVRMQRAWRPPTDVYETDEHLVIKVEIAGMEKDDFDISLVGRAVIITGCRPHPRGKMSYENMEIQYGEFRTEVHIRWPIEEADRIEASYENGFIFVRIPKPRQQRIRIREIAPSEEEES